MNFVAETFSTKYNREQGMKYVIKGNNIMFLSIIANKQT